MAVRGGKKTMISELANKGVLQSICKLVAINTISDIGYHNYEFIVFTCQFSQITDIYIVAEL